MAKGDYYIEGRSLYYDNGNGFINKGNADGSSNRALRQNGREVNSSTKKPVNEASNSEPVKTTIKITSPKATAGSTGGLRYPNQIDKDTDYVSFEFFEYNPPFGRGEGESLEVISNQNAYNLYQQSGSKEKAKPSNLSPIILYMPEDIQSQYGARWGGADFSTAAVGLARLSGTSLASADSAVMSALGMSKAKVYDEILKKINEITGSSIGLDQFMGSVSGTILNPNTEMLYEGGQLRTFSLSFKMTPKNSTEALDIKKICNTFKKAMLPTFGGQAAFGAIQSPALIKVPNLCQVTFMTGGKPHEYLPVYKLCAIAGVDVNYTPDGAYATYKGGSPVSTLLTVSFKETKMLFSDDINTEGYSY